ncbi:bifunctional protein-disulfide isomerase/oxidoreductase DsbC [Pragia fontium]|uniref:Thiol:disulfide interchange protein n=2 Tax=Pragia fontium TaxID=82985 RepID=A0AAJ4WA04_9GAMM|nr:bifunctional protein-disulfide isomerase/oxidoreductase DsbC [Pragia fontium]AKJ43130.1 protein-disulfide isomerase [Pragia fontium]SFC65763.1 Thiol:disulfide interchange protein DsbC [Pragia fontium DSM 5563 = ATCC 49100]SUB83578.1 Thiol:disulfide interchange protein DsbC precursor [Pragia fontium]VEJ56483.1 Thiol:disulfide interchange protein DsbC precursor [Pragia fontium]GKX63482.1 thiol:disulfide interchange protein DsbC [Pragia fontium]
MKKGLWLFTLALTALASVSQADDAAIKQALQQKVGATQIDILPSPIAGLQTVLTEGGVLYVSSDGKHILSGPLYDISGPMPVNATNEQLGPILSKRLEALKDEMIIYKAPQEKYVVTVFTDITCGYCTKLHKEMSGYNDLGITVRYLAYPRQGPDSDAEKKMASIWCAEDRMTAFDNAMTGKAVKPATCKIDLKRHYELGSLYGIQGTPAIIVDGATVVPGYSAPSDLKASLDAYIAHKNVAKAK